MSVRFRDKCKPFILFYVQITRFRGVTTNYLILLLADRSVKIPKRIVENVILKVDEFYFSSRLCGLRH